MKSTTQAQLEILFAKHESHSEDFTEMCDILLRMIGQPKETSYVEKKPT